MFVEGFGSHGARSRAREVRAALVTLTIAVLLGIGLPTAAHADNFAISAFQIDPCTQAGTPAVPGTLPSGNLGSGTPCSADDTQAADHPFSLYTGLALSSFTDMNSAIEPSGTTADVRVDLPPGVVANPQAVPQCTDAQFVKIQNSFVGNGVKDPGCPADTQIGELWIDSFFNGINPTATPVGLYNMVPGPGEPARFALLAPFVNLRVNLDAGVRTYPVTLPNGQVEPGDYGFFITIKDLPPNLGLLAQGLEIFGAPQEQNECSANNPAQKAHFVKLNSPDGSPNCPASVADNAFVSNPTSCGSSLTATLTATEYDPAQLSQTLTDYTTAVTDPSATSTYHTTLTDPGLDSAPRGQSVSMPYALPPMTGCNSVPFGSAAGRAPTLSVTPTDSTGNPLGSAAHDTATDLQVTLNVPQDLNPAEPATPDLQNIRVTLPAGFSINPAANPTGAGLQSCADSQFGLTTGSADTCSQLAPGSLAGTVTLTSPDLADPLTGNVYLGSQLTGDPFRLFLDASADGVDVRLTGSISSDPTTGQLTTTFTNNPQVPVSSIKLQFIGGANSAIATPIECGTFPTTSSITPWTGVDAASPSAATTIDADGQGGACGSSFSPAVTPGFSTLAAAASPTFTTTITRPAGQPYLNQFSVALPPGLLAHISAVPQCNPSAGCTSANQIGNVTIEAGSGTAQQAFGGTVYLTGPVNGDPFGLLISVPVVIGPAGGSPVYSFGTTTVQAGFQIDPHDSHATISGAIPTMQDFTVSTAAGNITEGVPVRIQSLVLSVNRAGFMVNPTNCGPLSGSATIGGIDPLVGPNGTAFSSTSALHMQATGCGSLPFTPSYTATTNGKTSSASGASLDVKLTQPPGQSNIKSAAITLPAKLAARYATEQSACPAATFAANPANCPATSLVGTVTAVTPLLSVPLTGTAYYVYQASLGLPDVDVILTGEGVTFDLKVSNALSASGGIVASLNSPDVPISSFELNFGQGPHSLLATSTSLCPGPLAASATTTGQNGAQVTASIPVQVTGCPKTSNTVKLKLGKHKFKNGKVFLSASTSTAGRFSLSGASLHHRWNFKRLGKAGSVTLGAALSHAAMAQLHRHHHVKIRLRVGFLPKSKSVKTAKKFVTFTVRG